MLQGSLSVIVIVLAFLAIVGVIILWRNKGWFLQWLKGSFGFLLVIFVIVCGFVLSDLWSYKQFEKEHPIATISVYKLSDQEYDITIATPDGEEQRYQILGDQWQLDVRLLTWKGPLAASGMMPLYRLDRLSGRYLSLEQERTAPRSVYSLAQSRWFDLWQWLNQYSFWLDAHFGSAVFMPLSNGAVYSIRLTPKGLLAKPLNDAAEEALSRSW